MHMSPFHKVCDFKGDDLTWVGMWLNSPMLFLVHPGEGYSRRSVSYLTVSWQSFWLIVPIDDIRDILEVAVYDKKVFLTLEQMAARFDVI